MPTVGEFLLGIAFFGEKVKGALKSLGGWLDKKSQKKQQKKLKAEIAKLNKKRDKLDRENKKINKALRQPKIKPGKKKKLEERLDQNAAASYDISKKINEKTKR